MLNRIFSVSVAFGGFFLLCSASLFAARPNVVLIMTDDQGYGDLSLTGNEFIETPNMDRVAKEGAWLKQFYVSPVCTPTRAHLMTGRYAYRTRAFDTWLGRANMEPAEVTIAESLSKAGYATGIFGKWHLGDYYPTRATDQGFSESLVHKGGGLRQPSNPPDGQRYDDPILYHNGAPKRYEGYCTNIFFDEAIKFIESANESEKPFFAYIPTNAPHGPYDEPPTRELMEHFLAKFPDDKNANRAGFYAMIKNVDNNMGRLLAKLVELEIDEETLVIFLTDNGPSAGSAGPFRAKKGSVYEGGIRTVCFLRWPGKIKPGSSSNQTAAHIDLLPTILDFCEVAPQEGVKLDGRSVRPLIPEIGIQGTAEWPDRHLFLQWHRGDVPYRHHCFATIGPNGRYKLVSQGNRGQAAPEMLAEMELYDLENDAAESKDIAASHPEIVARLKKEYDAWFDDVSSTRNPNFGMPPIVVGAKEQPEVVLTNQDKRADKVEANGWTTPGYWPIDVRQAGPYTFEILLTKDVTKETKVRADIEVDGKTTSVSVTIPRGVDSAPIGNVSFPATGMGEVRVRVADGEPRGPGVYQISIK